MDLTYIFGRFQNIDVKHLLSTNKLASQQKDSNPVHSLQTWLFVVAEWLADLVLYHQSNMKQMITIACTDILKN